MLIRTVQTNQFNPILNLKNKLRPKNQPRTQKWVVSSPWWKTVASPSIRYIVDFNMIHIIWIYFDMVKYMSKCFIFIYTNCYSGKYFNIRLLCNHWRQANGDSRRKFNCFTVRGAIIVLIIKWENSYDPKVMVYNIWMTSCDICLMTCEVHVS